MQIHCDSVASGDIFLVVVPIRYLFNTYLDVVAICDVTDYIDQCNMQRSRVCSDIGVLFQPIMVSGHWPREIILDLDPTCRD